MKIVAIVNRESGSGHSESILKNIRFLLGSSLDDVFFPVSRNETCKLARKIAFQGVDIIIVVGGDGTLNAVANGLVGTRCKLAIVPCGTANDLAHCNRNPTRLETTCDMILKGRYKKIDIISVNGWYFLTTGGLGFPANVVHRVNNWRSGSGIQKLAMKIMGRWSYMAGTLTEYFHTDRRGYQMNIQYQDNQLKGCYHLLIISNQSTTARIFKVTPDASNCDGKLDVFLAAANGSMNEFAGTVLRTIGGRHTKRSNAVLCQSRQMTIEVETPLDFLGDGELIIRDTKFEVKVIPAGLRLICPGNTVPL